MKRTTKQSTIEVEGGQLSTSIVVLTTVVVVPLVVLVATVWLLGWHFAVVQTNSMAPGMPAGSLIVASPVSPADVSAGMVIEFVDRRHGDRRVTHRVVEVHRNESGDFWFVTQGDNNDARDSEPVRPRDVRAEVRWSVAGLGRAVALMQPPLSYVLPAVPFGLWLVSRMVKAGMRTMRKQDSTTSTVGLPELNLTCSDCPAPVAREDRYCRRCGARQVASAEAARPRVQLSSSDPPGVGGAAMATDREP